MDIYCYFKDSDLDVKNFVRLRDELWVAMCHVIRDSAFPQISLSFIGAYDDEETPQEKSYKSFRQQKRNKTVNACKSS